MRTYKAARYKAKAKALDTEAVANFGLNAKANTSRSDSFKLTRPY